MLFSLATANYLSVDTTSLDVVTDGLMDFNKIDTWIFLYFVYVFSSFEMGYKLS